MKRHAAARKRQGNSNGRPHGGARCHKPLKMTNCWERSEAWNAEPIKVVDCPSGVSVDANGRLCYLTDNSEYRAWAYLYPCAWDLPAHMQIKEEVGMVDWLWGFDNIDSDVFVLLLRQPHFCFRPECDIIEMKTWSTPTTHARLISAVTGVVEEAFLSISTATGLPDDIVHLCLEYHLGACPAFLATWNQHEIHMQSE